MGIPNFTQFVNVLLQDKDVVVQPIDSILIDVQSMLYIAIDNALEPHETDMMTEIQKSVQEQIEKTIRDILKEFVLIQSHLTIILTFDGEGVPMKWPTQRQRRQGSTISGKKNTFKVSLFGNNIISQKVQNKIVSSLKQEEFYRSLFQNFNIDQVRILVSGCHVEGEGEHKLFNLAEEMACKHPLVVSVDNDVFILSFLRLKRYESIQIYKKPSLHYNVSHFVKDILPYPVDLLIATSFLFGNDFIPSLLSITHNNVMILHDALTTCCSETTTLPKIIHWVLQKCQHCMRFVKTPSVNEDVVVQFWITCLWILDYYSGKPFFIQKRISNQIYDLFDRNMILTALHDSQMAEDTYQTAVSVYNDDQQIKNQISKENGKNVVFSPTNLKIVSKYFATATAAIVEDIQARRRKTKK